MSKQMRAFPTGDNRHPEPTDGITLRDWFAGMALDAVLTNTENILPRGERRPRDEHDAAWMAYAIANAMIKARGENNEQS